MSRLPDELLLDIAFVLGNNDRVDFDRTSRRVFGPAVEALVCDSGLLMRHIFS
jgi:hypothetical protein